MGKAKEVYDFIRDYAEEEGCVPTVREICDGVGLKSTASVHYYLKHLILTGSLIERPGKVPAYKLAGYELIQVIGQNKTNILKQR